MRKFEYQWRQVTRCSENSHIMPALEKFGADGWKVFAVEPMRREIIEAPELSKTETV